MTLLQTPTRRYADTFPPAAHFERNDITIVCETVQARLGANCKVSQLLATNPMKCCNQGNL